MSVLAGRWQDVLPGRYEPETAIVITDPPFGLGKRLREGGSLAKGYDDDTPWAVHVAEVLELLPAHRHVIRGPGLGFLSLNGRKPRRLCVEVSRYRARGRTPPATVAHMWFGWGVWGALRITNRAEHPEDAWVYDHGHTDPQRPTRRGYGHQAGSNGGVTPWPAAWAAVSTWGERGAFTILDPFAGVGTIGRACLQRRIPYLGAETNAGWAAEANQRLGFVQQGAGL